MNTTGGSNKNLVTCPLGCRPLFSTGRTLCRGQRRPCFLSCRTSSLWSTRRPPVCLNLISITDQLSHSISKLTRALTRARPAIRNLSVRRPIVKKSTEKSPKSLRHWALRSIESFRSMEKIFSMVQRRDTGRSIIFESKINIIKNQEEGPSSAHNGSTNVQFGCNISIGAECYSGGKRAAKQSSVTSKPKNRWSPTASDLL